MALNDFGYTLGKCLFNTVAGRRAVEFVDRQKPVERDENFFLAGEVVSPCPFKGQVLEHFAGDIQIPGIIVH